MNANGVIFSKTQSGMVLLLCLIFLTAMTLLGLSASADTILQNQLSANLQKTERAKQSALASLNWVEDWLLGLDGPAPETCTTRCEGLYLHSPGDLPPHPEHESLSWWQDHGHQAGFDPATGNQIAHLAGAGTSPHLWLIEAVYSIPPSGNSTGDLLVWYRILARGQGQTESIISVIESTVVRSWPSMTEPDLSVNDGSKPCPGSRSAEKCSRISWRELR
jgi:Tfp pilus assembly protein PilX